jgi:hypothetical protein
MAGSFTLPTVLANLTAGNQPLSLIDGDLTTLRDPLLALSTFANYYTDTGAANAYAITVSSPQTVSLAAGLPIQFKATNANTGASTLQINALAAKNILNPNGTALSNAQISAGAVVTVIYDGTQFMLLGAQPTYSFLTNSLAADVALNNTANFFDGPSVAQGTVGTWFASGTVGIQNAAASTFQLKLWDGTTTFASAFFALTGAAGANQGSCSLSGFITSPAGNIRISVKDPTQVTANIKFNVSGLSKDSTVTAVRIA